jgi:hypothetical protein
MAVGHNSKVAGKVNQMAEGQLAKNVRSFVSFALAQKPSVSIRESCPTEGSGAIPNNSIEITFDPKKKLSEREVSSLDSLLKKYESIKGSLRPKHARVDLDIKTCSPTLTFQADVNYQLLNVNSEQLEIAREVADRVERTHELHTGGKHEAARSEYDDLQKYLARQRSTLLGDFKNVNDFSAVVGSHGVDRRARADSDCGGLVIFIVIEIFIG